MKVHKLMQMLNAMGPNNNIVVQEGNSEGRIVVETTYTIIESSNYSIGPLSLSHENRRTPISAACLFVLKRGVSGERNLQRASRAPVAPVCGHS
jgi:hypothetical protein